MCANLKKSSFAICVLLLLAVLAVCCFFSSAAIAAGYVDWSWYVPGLGTSTGTEGPFASREDAEAWIAKWQSQVPGAEKATFDIRGFDDATPTRPLPAPPGTEGDPGSSARARARRGGDTPPTSPEQDPAAIRSLRTIPNPARLEAESLLKERRLPWAEAQARLYRDLEIQGERIKLYRLERATGQLLCSTALMKKAAQVSQDPGSLEQAAFLWDQGAKAMTGDWLTEESGQVAVPEVPVASPARVVDQYRKVAAKVQGLFDAAKALEAERERLNEETARAKRVSDDLSAKTAEIERQIKAKLDSAKTDEEKATESSVLKEALAARAQAERNLKEVEAVAQKTGKALGDALSKATDAAQSLSQAGLDSQKLDDLWGNFKAASSSEVLQ